MTNNKQTTNKPTKKRPIQSRSLNEDSRHCYVTFTVEAPERAAHPAVVMGDVLGDLPAVHNFCLSEAAKYRCGAAFLWWCLSRCL